MTDFLDLDASPSFRLRPYQEECLESIERGWQIFSRQLAILVTGAGKTVIFAQVAKREVGRGGRVLIIAHTDELLDQAIDKIYRTTGLECDKEKADQHASPHASIVVASIQTISRDHRLTGFEPGHFSLLVCDETHRALAKSYQKVLNFFHFGADSMKEDWVAPAPEVPYRYHARCLGVTATPERADKRSLGEFYQNVAYEYDMIRAVQDGYLVRPFIRNIPIQLDIRGVKKKGGDLDAMQIAQRITPFLDVIAMHLARDGADRKGAIFMPSVETARLMAEALRKWGVDADYVSGECDDRAEKIEAFHNKGNNSAIVNAMLLVEGWDHDQVSYICVLRSTKLRSLLMQCVGRGMRTITGTLDGLETAEERLLAIADSAKKDLMIFDFLWLADSIDLVSPFDLVTSRRDVREAMKKTGETDIVSAEKEAQRDLLEHLEREAAKHKHRQPRTIDPIKWAVSLGDEVLSGYKPETSQDAAPPSKIELDFILAEGLATHEIKTSGMAQKIISHIEMRKKAKLASVKQMNFLRKLGIPEDSLALMPARTAGAIIGRKQASWN